MLLSASLRIPRNYSNREVVSLKKKQIRNKKRTFMKGKMEIGDVGIGQNRALKITFLYQISSELRFAIFPNLWKNAIIFPNSTDTDTSPQKVKKITESKNDS